MTSKSQAAIHQEDRAAGVTPAGIARYAALVRIDVVPVSEPSGRRSGMIASSRHVLGSLLTHSDATVLSARPGSVLVELAAPSLASSFAIDAMRVLAMSGFEGRAALHVAWVAWTGREHVCEDLHGLNEALDRARPGQILATEAFRMLLHGDSRTWNAIGHRASPSMVAYELAGVPVSDARRATGAQPRAMVHRGRRTGSLSRREREVAGLVARGQSNREVASALRIAPSTVERHVSNLFGKLDVNSRVAVAVIAASGQL